MLARMLCLWLAAAGVASAQSQFVNDRLRLGLHEAASISSPILELIDSGTELEVLERDDDMARVQLGSGATGWVDARYLSADPPGRAQVVALERELAGAQAALADAQAQLVALNQSQPAAATAEDSTGEQAIPSDALREMQSLAEENQRLKQQVVELEAVQRMSQEAAPEATPSETPAPAALPPPAAAPAAVEASAASLIHSSFTLPGELQAWHLVLLASVLLLAFAAGGWLVDWGVRRRHGGFRV